MSGMGHIVTLAERKAAEAERRRRAVEALRPVLAAYARVHGGRFLLFGSAARGQMRFGGARTDAVRQRCRHPRGLSV
jgi:hypothetical protein